MTVLSWSDIQIVHRRLHSTNVSSNECSTSNSEHYRETLTLCYSKERLRNKRNNNKNNWIYSSLETIYAFVKHIFQNSEMNLSSETIFLFMIKQTDVNESKTLPSKPL